MTPLPLHDLHAARGAHFAEINGKEMVAAYHSTADEYSALSNITGLLDLSFRSRLCLLGQDRVKFLNGQITNNLKDLKPGSGCHAALVSAKGKIQSDLHVYILENEILLDFEPGLEDAVRQRLEAYIVADDVQLADVSPHYGLWSMQGPAALAALSAIFDSDLLPKEEGCIALLSNSGYGELYAARHIRTGQPGFDIFVPTAEAPALADKLIDAVTKMGGRLCGQQAFEIARIEAGQPRYGQDMDESNLAPEVLPADAISYAKGCYIGQEIIARIRTYGQVSRALRGIRWPANSNPLPAKNDKLFYQDKEVGHITSAAYSPRLQQNIALAMIRRECNAIGTELILKTGGSIASVQIVDLPFVAPAR